MDRKKPRSAGGPPAKSSLKKAGLTTILLQVVANYLGCSEAEELKSKWGERYDKRAQAESFI